MKGCYYCDSVGFKNIKFDTDKCEKMDGLRTLMILPREKPIETRVVDELESWQKAVSRQGEDSMVLMLIWNCLIRFQGLFLTLLLFPLQVKIQ